MCVSNKYGRKRWGRVEVILAKTICAYTQLMFSSIFKFLYFFFSVSKRMREIRWKINSYHRHRYCRSLQSLIVCVYIEFRIFNRKLKKKKNRKKREKRNLNGGNSSGTYWWLKWILKNHLPSPPPIGLNAQIVIHHSALGFIMLQRYLFLFQAAIIFCHILFQGRQRDRERKKLVILNCYLFYSLLLTFTFSFLYNLVLKATKNACICVPVCVCVLWISSQTVLCSVVLIKALQFTKFRIHSII